MNKTVKLSILYNKDKLNAVFHVIYLPFFLKCRVIDQDKLPYRYLSFIFRNKKMLAPPYMKTIINGLIKKQ